MPGWDLLGSGLHISKTPCFYHVHLKNLGEGILRRLAPCKFRKPTVPQALQMAPPEFAGALQHPPQHVAPRIADALTDALQMLFRLGRPFRNGRAEASDIQNGDVWAAPHSPAESNRTYNQNEQPGVGSLIVAAS